MVVPDILKEGDFSGSEIFQKDSVNFLPEHFLNVLNGLGVIPFKLLNKITDAVIPLL